MRWTKPPRSTVMSPLFVAKVCQMVSTPRVSRCCTERRSTTSIARATGAMVTHSASSPLISRALLSDALDTMPFDDPVSAAAERTAADAHRLQVAIAPTTHGGADDIGCGLQHPLFFGDTALIEPLAPCQARVRINCDGAVHAADLAAKTFNGALQSAAGRGARIQEDLVAAELNADQVQF